MDSDSDRGRSRPTGWFAAHLAVFFTMLLLVLLRYAPPDARGPDAAGDVFSAGRVGSLLEKLLGAGTPHPMGSLEHARVRNAVIAEFRAIGLEPEVQAAFSRDSRGSATQVQNVVVHLRGTEGTDAIALVAHYDSVPAGPGAADDASGMCSILEIARILSAGPRPPNDVIFLISDAEEVGLCGARAFAAGHPLMAKIRVVLNWEARGTRGPSFMFETGPNNLGPIRLMARHCRRSISTSLFPAIYRLLPHDTDLSVFKEQGVAGMNFAFIGGAPHYHRPSDNLANLDLGSVQHQGEHFLAMTRALAEAHLGELPNGDAVFFDVLGWFTVAWPQQWNLVIAITAGVLALGVLLLSLRKSERWVRDLVLGLLVWPLGLVAAGLLGAGACWLVIRYTGTPDPWWSWPQPFWVAIWSIGLGTPVAVWSLVRKHASGRVLSSVMVVYWALCGIVTAWYLPGASYLFTVPAAVACVFCVIASWRGLAWEPANLAFLSVACALWLPLARGLVEAIGFRAFFAHTTALGLIGLLIAPAIAADTRVDRFLLFGLILTIIGLAGAMLVPVYSERWPQPVSITYTQDDHQAILAATATAGPLPEPMRRAIAGQPDRDLPHHVAWKVPRDATPPTVEVLEDKAIEGGRRLKLLVKPGKNQHRVGFEAAPDFGSDVSINGSQIVTPLKWLTLDFSEQTEAVIELTTSGKITLHVAGVHFGLPRSADPLREARPARAEPVGWGDYSQVRTRREF